MANENICYKKALLKHENSLASAVSSENIIINFTDFSCKNRKNKYGINDNNISGIILNYILKENMNLMSYILSVSLKFIKETTEGNIYRQSLKLILKS